MTTELKTVTPTGAPAERSTNTFIFDLNSMEKIESFAQLMAKGTTTIPKHLQKNPADCAAIIIQALTWNMIPHAVAQKTHIINGALGYEAQLVNSVINAMAPTRDRLHFEWYGPWTKFLENTSVKENELGCGVRVWATLKGEDSPRVMEVEMSQATVRNSPLWKSDPKQQLAYLATKKWARLYVPDVIMGVYTPEDLDERPIKDINEVPVESSVKSLVKEKPEFPKATLEERIKNYLNIIADAQNMNRLRSIGQQIAAAEPEIQDAVRNAYADRIDEFKPKKKHVDIETGEISDEMPPSDALGFDQLEKLIDVASDMESLKECRQLVEANLDHRTKEYKDLSGRLDVRMNEMDEG